MPGAFVGNLFPRITNGSSRNDSGSFRFPSLGLIRLAFDLTKLPTAVDVRRYLCLTVFVSPRAGSFPPGRETPSCASSPRSAERERSTPRFPDARTQRRPVCPGQLDHPCEHLGPHLPGEPDDVRGVLRPHGNHSPSQPQELGPDLRRFARGGLVEGLVLAAKHAQLDAFQRCPV